MPIQLSKILLVIQLLLFGAIPGVVLVMFAPAAIVAALVTGSFLVAVLTILLGASLVSAAVVVTTFCSQGAAGLRSIRWHLWLLCAIGAVLSLAGAAILTVKTNTFVVSDDLDPLLRAAGIGSPLVLAYVHVLLEYFLRKPVQHAA